MIKKNTKIICSIGPASCKVDVMTNMVNNGMNVARINFSHATLEEKQAVVATVKEVRKITGKNIAILYDTKGPEFRCGMHENDELELVVGNTIRIVKETVLGNKERFSVNHASALNSVNVGTNILLENGLMKLEVKSIEQDGVTCEIISGGILGNKKSMSVPGVKLDIPFISDIDREDIIYAAEHEGDYLAASFVSCMEDVIEVREILKQCNREDMKIIAKIESQTGLDNLASIVEVSDGVMVARGDLGEEIDMTSIPCAQKTIIDEARKQGKIAVVATEMLESMKKNIRPTRAETSDITLAVMQGTDAVMLSGETTMGHYPAETVAYMAKICATAEKTMNTASTNTITTHYLRDALCDSSVKLSKNLESKLIVSASLKGTAPRKMSNLRPDCQILALVTNEGIARGLALNFGVYPMIVDTYTSTDLLVKDAIRCAKEFTTFEDNDSIVITGGFSNGESVKSTNFIKVEIM